MKKSNFYRSVPTRVPAKYHVRTGLKKKKMVRRRCVPMEYRTRTGTRYVLGTGTLSKTEYPCITDLSNVLTKF
jgi:hypothetical protein